MAHSVAGQGLTCYLLVILTDSLQISQNALGTLQTKVLLASGFGLDCTGTFSLAVKTIGIAVFPI
jgi:hypothetical protein